MDITQLLSEQLHDAIHGEAFHGQSLLELLEGVSVQQAMAKPIPGGHSIWETLLHIRVWLELCADACDGKPIPKWPFAIEKDWPAPGGTNSNPSPADWQRDVRSTFASAERLRQGFLKVGDGKLESIVPGRDYDFFLLLNGEIKHTI